MAEAWREAFGRAPPKRRVALLYLASDAVQTAPRRAGGSLELAAQLWRVVPAAMAEALRPGADAGLARAARKVGALWIERKVFGRAGSAELSKILGRAGPAEAAKVLGRGDAKGAHRDREGITRRDGARARDAGAPSGRASPDAKRPRPTAEAATISTGDREADAEAAGLVAAARQAQDAAARAAEAVTAAEAASGGGAAAGAAAAAAAALAASAGSFHGAAEAAGRLAAALTAAAARAGDAERRWRGDGPRGREGDAAGRAAAAAPRPPDATAAPWPLEAGDAASAPGPPSWPGDDRDGAGLSGGWLGGDAPGGGTTADAAAWGDGAAWGEGDGSGSAWGAGDADGSAPHAPPESAGARWGDDAAAGEPGDADAPLELGGAAADLAAQLASQDAQALLNAIKALPPADSLAQ